MREFSQRIPTNGLYIAAYTTNELYSNRITTGRNADFAFKSTRGKLKNQNRMNFNKKGSSQISYNFCYHKYGVPMVSYDLPRNQTSNSNGVQSSTSRHSIAFKQTSVLYWISVWIRPAHKYYSNALQHSLAALMCSEPIRCVCVCASFRRFRSNCTQEKEIL